ncbi:MAG: hypothetical protein ACRAVC_20300, partial [Trichormus sp.]
INGGAGNDIFDVGFGSAKLDGGQGFDTLVLQTLGSGVYNIGTPGVDGWLEITNTASSNTLLVRNIELISFGAVTLV